MENYLSPFRYPGGKNWLTPYIRSWLLSLPDRPSQFSEPFAGGAAVGLMVAAENLADHVTLLEIDNQVASVWETIISGNAKGLANKIATFEFTKENVDSILAKKCKTKPELAFQTIIRNRINRAGILAPGAGKLKNGENGKGIKSRWYPDTLKNRILRIIEFRERITFIKGDGIDFIKNNQQNDKMLFFIDPPYTVDGKKAGTRLYSHFDMDHEDLFLLVSKVKGKFVLTYSNDEKVRNLANKFGFAMKEVKMRTSHHTELTELLISKNPL